MASAPARSDTASAASAVDIKWVAEPPATGRGRTAFRQAKALFQDGHTEEALRMYTQVRDSLDRSDSYWAICHNQMGLCYSKLGNDAEAVKSYTTAIETGVHKDMHIWHMNRAVKLKVSGDFERAKADFERVIQLRSDSPQAQKAKDHLARMQSSERYSTLQEPQGGSRLDANSHRSVRNHVIDLWNRLATAFAEASDANPSLPRRETPPDSVCCSLLLLGDLEILKWFLVGTTAQLGPNPWKAQGCLDDVDVLARLTPHSIPIISRWLGDMCESGNVSLASRSTAVRKWLSNDSVVKSAPVSMHQVEARLCDSTLEHCAAISGDVAVVQWFTATFSLAREKRLQDLAAKVEVDPDDTESIALLSTAVSPAPTAHRGDTPDCFIPDRSIVAVAQHPLGGEGQVVDSSKEARKYLNDMYTSVERYRLESACTKGIPLGIYVAFWTLEAFALYNIVLRDPYESFQALHTISWYSCAVVLFAFSWLIPGLRDVGPIPGWLVQGVPAVLWGGGLATFCVIQMLTAFQRLAKILPEYADWTHTCTGMLLFLGYLVPHTQPLSTWSSALAYGHSISWSLLLIYLVNQVAWGTDDIDLESDGFFLVVQATFYATSAFHPCQFPAEDDQDHAFKNILVWSYTLLWRLLLFLVTAGMGEWMIGPWVPTVMYSLAMLQTGCLTLLITYTTLWYSFDADKNIAKQAYVKVRVTLYMFGLVQPLKRELKDDLRDWRARTIKDRLATQLQETLATVQNGFGAPKALTRYDCANPRSPQKRQFNLDYLRATKLVDDEIDLVALGESLDPDLAQHMLTLTDKLQDYIFGCLNACLTRHDKLMRGVPPILNGAAGDSSEQLDPVFFDEVVGMLMFLIDEGARWEKRFAEGDCDGPTVADRRELAIGRAWLANVPAQRLRILQAWDRARQEKVDAEKARQEEARLRQLEEAKRAAEAEVEREKLVALREQQRKEDARKAAERRLLEEARLAEQAKVEEANRKKREEARLKRQKEAAALKDAQRREQMLATKKKQLSTEEEKAKKFLKNGDPSAAAKAFTKAIRVATDLNDEKELERLKKAKEDALSAAAALAEQAKAKAAEEKARRKAAEEERKLAAEAERERLVKLEQRRQEEAAARALAERRAKHNATIERIDKAVAKTREMLERGEGTQAVRAIEKVPTLMQMLDSEFGGGISQDELAKLQSECKAAEVEYMKKSAELAEQKKKETAERRKKQAEEKAAAEKKAAEEKEAAEAAAAVAAAKAAEEEAEREKAKIAAEAAAFEAQMAEYALKEAEQKEQDEAEETSDTADGSTSSATGAVDGSANAESEAQGDFNIEMALGRDLLGDLGMDDDDLDGSCE